jgi:hypothetical protein
VPSAAPSTRWIHTPPRRLTVDVAQRVELGQQFGRADGSQGFAVVGTRTGLAPVRRAMKWGLGACDGASEP